MTTMTTDSHDKREEAPERIWVQIYESLIPNTISVNAYDLDPRQVHDNGKPVYEYIRADLAATRMREKCVEKVRSIRNDWNRLTLWEQGVEAANRIIAALESITLDGEGE